MAWWLKLVATTWSGIMHCLRALETNADFWNPFWASIVGAGVGAFLAFTLERYRRKRDRIRHELGKCHTLVFMLVHTLQMLEAIRDDLFETDRVKHPRRPKWYEVGGLEAAPKRGPRFSVEDYAFLLDPPNRKIKAPELLNKIYIATANFDALLELIRLRTPLWNKDRKLQAAARDYVNGKPPAQTTPQFDPDSDRVRDLTRWLAQDLREAIAHFRELFSLLDEVLQQRYPTKSFLYPRVTSGAADAGPLIDESP